MNKEKSYYLEDGIDALNEGRKAEARKLLASAIREDPQSETAWLGMAYAVEEEERYIECMERVLQINPENEKARKALEKYQASKKLSVAGEKLGRYGILAVVALVVFCVLAALSANALRNLFSPREPVPTRLPMMFTPTSPPTPTKTPIPPTLTKTAVLPTLTRTVVPSPTSEKHGVDLFPCVPASPPLFALVSQVLDGDTIEVIISGVTFPVGYIGVAAPDITSVYGEEAAKVNRSLVEGQEVWLYTDVSDRDEEGRLLRYVFAGDVFVNFKILRLGYGAAVEVLPDTACSNLFKEIAISAKNNSQGLWQFTDLSEPSLTPTEQDG
jgi:endonuclease YncB( thermonuclease family)